MSGNYPAGVTDNQPEFDRPDDPFWEAAANKESRDDAIERLQQAGMEPMSTAPLDREIIIVLEANLVKVKAFWQDDIFSGGCWMDANGDGATDGVWRHWDNDELIGWLPVPTALNPLIGGV